MAFRNDFHRVAQHRSRFPRWEDVVVLEPLPRRPERKTQTSVSWLRSLDLFGQQCLLSLVPAFSLRG
jgi:hypothetical protein